jgi:S1-C subfamily serine protease
VGVTRAFPILLFMSACAVAPAPDDGVVPGSIGTAFGHGPTGVSVKALASRAASAGLRVGDVVLRYNGEKVAGTRQLNRLIVDSRPGTVARLEILRDGKVHLVDVPVEQLDTTPRV